MAQHDYDIAGGSGSAIRADLNAALAAIVSQNAGPEEPTPVAGMWWQDMTEPALKLRNAANSAWVVQSAPTPIVYAYRALIMRTPGSVTSTSLSDGTGFHTFNGWASAVYDVGSWWSSSAPSRLVVPAGVAAIAMAWSLRIAAPSSPTPSDAASCGARILKNGAVLTPNLEVRVPTVLRTSVATNPSGASGLIPVSEGDYFELQSFVDDYGGSPNLTGPSGTWWSIWSVA